MMQQFQKKWTDGNVFYKQFKDEKAGFRPRLIKARQAKEQYEQALRVSGLKEADRLRMYRSLGIVHFEASKIIPRDNPADIRDICFHYRDALQYYSKIVGVTEDENNQCGVTDEWIAAIHSKIIDVVDEVISFILKISTITQIKNIYPFNNIYSRPCNLPLRPEVRGKRESHC